MGRNAFSENKIIVAYNVVLIIISPTEMPFSPCQMETDIIVTFTTKNSEAVRKWTIVFRSHDIDQSDAGEIKLAAPENRQYWTWTQIDKVSPISCKHRGMKNVVMAENPR